MILEVFTTIAGIAMSLGYFPQAYNIWKNKSAQNISMLSYSVFSVGTTLWLIYGIYLKSAVVMLSFMPGVVGSWTVLALTIYYNRIGGTSKRKYKK